MTHHAARRVPSAGAVVLTAVSVRVQFDRSADNPAGRVALHDVSLTVRGGHMIAVTGPSGAGKTSLMTVLGGARRPTGGSVRLDGIDLFDRDDAVTGGVTLIPQGNSLVRILTAIENVALPLLGRPGRPPAQAPRQVRLAAQELLVALGLDGAGGQLVEELSGGQQQRVAVARGLLEAGRIVLADEPTSELDAVNRTRVMAGLRVAAMQGAGVVIATHDPEAAAECDAELHLDDGHATWVRDDR